MLKVTRLLALLLVLLTTPEAAASPEAFPASWAGTWKGPCVLVRDGETVRRFPMELHIEPLEASEGWTWRVVYGAGARRRVRPYEILPVPGEPNHFVIDEKNGVRIDAYLENDRLHSRFGVMGHQIETTYARDGDELRVTLTTFGTVAATTSGGVDGLPPVAAYPLEAVQRSTLRRAGSSKPRTLDTEAHVLELLVSDRLEDRAWGAYLAGSLRYPAAPPAPLVAALLEALRAGGRDEPALAAGVLDALLRLDARVDPAHLVPWVDAYPAQVLLLLGRRPTEARAVLLSLLEAEDLGDATWMAAVGLLVEDRAPGVAEHVLRGLELRLEVSVLPGKNMVIGIGGGDDERQPELDSLTRVEPRSGWPPYVTYALTDVPATGDRVVAPTPVPVYARRTVFSSGAANMLRLLRPRWRRNEVRIRALAALTRTPPASFRLDERERTTVYWEGEKDYVGRVQTRWVYVQLQYDRLLDDLVEAGLLAAEVRAELPLPLTVHGVWFGLGSRELPRVPKPVIGIGESK